MTLRIRAVFLGAPGAGKGTQAKMLAERQGVLHISSGDMLREQRNQGTPLGRRAQAFMDRGELVPDDLMIEIVLDRVGRADAAQSWILDGFPRTLPQAQSLDRSLQDARTGRAAAVSHAIHFKVAPAVLVRRLTGRRNCSNPTCGAIWHVEFRPPKVAGVCDLCGGKLVQRSDDREDVVRQRLEAYRSQTEPLLDYYASRGILREVDAGQSPDVLFEELVRKLSGS